MDEGAGDKAAALGVSLLDDESAAAVKPFASRKDDKDANSPSVITRVMSVPGATVAVVRKRFRLSTPSVKIVALYIFLTGATKGFFLCSLWGYVDHLGGNEVQLGNICAMHAFGKLVAALGMARLADEYQHKYVLVRGSVLLLIGSVLYIVAPDIGGLGVLYASQFFMGMFCGGLAISRAFVVEQTVPRRRTYVVSRIYSIEYAGAFVTAGVGALLYTAGAMTDSNFKYRMPCVLLLLLGLLLLGLLVWVFQDLDENDQLYDNTSPSPHTSPSHANPIHAKSPELEAADNEVVKVGEDDVENAERVKVLQLILLVTFVLKAVLSVYETVGTEIMVEQYGMSVLSIGAFYTAAGVVGTVQMANFKKIWTDHFSDAALMLLSLVLLGGTSLLAVNWTTAHHPNIGMFLFSLVTAIALCFPIGMPSALGAYSVLQRTGRQSSYQSLLICVEAVAMILFPLISGVMEGLVEMFSTFSLLLMIIAACVVAIIALHEPLNRFTDRTAVLESQNPDNPQAPKVPPECALEQPTLLVRLSVRQALLLLAAFLAAVGFATLIVSLRD